jgi:hypothetical protein
MHKENNLTRKGKALGTILIREESKAAMRVRLDSEEGQRCLAEFAKIIAEWAARSMPLELLQAMGPRG